MATHAVTVPVARTSSGFPALLYGVLVSGTGLTVYLVGVLLRAVSIFVDPAGHFTGIVRGMVWYSGIPVVAGIGLIVLDLFVLLSRKRTRTEVECDPPRNRQLTVVLTAYNDERSIGPAVEDFRRHPSVTRVIVVDNNSKDRTSEMARAAGAIVIQEKRAGYGNCVFRGLEVGANASDTELTLLCEGDMTFRAYDIEKFLAYAPHAEIVNGTRIVEQLREKQTQLTTFIFFGNFFVGKLLEAKHIGKGTLTDVGTTYKLCRNSTLRRLLPLLRREINLEFNAHFLDRALANGFSVVECPITFHSRVGASKGGNASNVRALKVGFLMILGIITDWRPLAWFR